MAQKPALLSRKFVQEARDGKGPLTPAAMSAIAEVHDIVVSANLLYDNKNGLTFVTDRGSLTFPEKWDFMKYSHAWELIAKSAKVVNGVPVFKRGNPLANAQIRFVMRRYCDYVYINTPLTSGKNVGDDPVIRFKPKNCDGEIALKTWEEVVAYSNMMKKILRSFNALTSGSAL